MITQESIDRTIDNRVSTQAAESTFREVDDTDRAIPAIEFRNVTMIYDDRAVLNDLSFKVMKGETKIILGGSGCGKSTTIKLVLGLIKPDSGQILVEGEDITNYNETQMMKVRRKLGMIFQEGALFDSLSVYENVAFKLHEQGVPVILVSGSSESLSGLPVEAATILEKPVSEAQLLASLRPLLSQKEPR